LLIQRLMNWNQSERLPSMLKERILIPTSILHHAQLTQYDQRVTGCQRNMYSKVEKRLLSIILPGGSWVCSWFGAWPWCSPSVCGSRRDCTAKYALLSMDDTPKIVICDQTLQEARRLDGIWWGLIKQQGWSITLLFHNQKCKANFLST